MTWLRPGTGERRAVLTVAIKDTGDSTLGRHLSEPKYYAAALTTNQLVKHDNGCLVSIGLVVPLDLRYSTLARWINQGIAKEITFDEWNHMGCQSSCKRRGGTECRW